MNERLELQRRLVDISNENLEKANANKAEMINEIFNSDLLSATLKVHMYVERELNLLYEYFFDASSGSKLQVKLELFYNLKIIDHELYTAIKKLNSVRNDLAHQLHFSKNNDIYKSLSASLSKDIKKYHTLEIQQREIVNGKLGEEEKYKILLAQLWIQVVIFCSSKERRKMEFGERLTSEVKSDIDKIEG